MKLLCAGGGTGGHIYPALAVAAALKAQRKDSVVTFVTGTKEMERSIINTAGYEPITIGIGAMPRTVSPAWFPFAFTLSSTTYEMKRFIAGDKPDVVLATGGYVSGPPILGARLAGVPVCIQEQNSYPGFTTRKLARFADTVFLGFADAARYVPSSTATVFTGNPVRPDIAGGDRNTAAGMFGLRPDMPTILVFGGSQGAGAINEAVGAVLDELLELDVQLLWQTGQQQHDRWKHHDNAGGGRVRVLDYIREMQHAYALADVAVTRAGAMTLAELQACGIPAVLVPLPTAAQNHQEHNARSVVEKGAAVMIRQDELSGERLMRELRQLVTSESRLAAMSSAMKRMQGGNAAMDIAAALLERYGNA